jgi:hypothetical protein
MMKDLYKSNDDITIMFTATVMGATSEEMTLILRHTDSITE